MNIKALRNTIGDDFSEKKRWGEASEDRPVFEKRA